MKVIEAISRDKDSFITLFAKWYNKRLLPLIKQFFFIPNIEEFVRLWISVMFLLLLESVLPELDHYLAIHTFPTCSSNFNLRVLML
jgi:hypothetical protein